MRCVARISTFITLDIKSLHKNKKRKQLEHKTKIQVNYFKNKHMVTRYPQ